MSLLLVNTYTTVGIDIKWRLNVSNENIVENTKHEKYGFWPIDWR